MNEESIEQIEQQLARLQPARSPAELRTRTLKTVHRRLAGQRWESRLARVAAALMVLGIGMNALMSGPSARQSSNSIATLSDPDVLVRTAVTVAQVSDAKAGSDFARHLAILSGSPLTDAQEAAIQQAIKQHLQETADARKEGKL